MKKPVLLFIVFVISFQVQSQKKVSVADFGKVFQIENPDLLLQKDNIYKVVFDVYTDGKKKSKKNSSIVTVARFINMHIQQGVPAKNLKVALVLHGAATKNSLNDLSYLKKYGKKNPNSRLLSALKQANVDIFVCGQSLYAKGYKKENISKNVQLSLSALTALVQYQSNEYQLINFN